MTEGAVPQFDVGVIGAGPAGSWAAYRLAQQGARVALFDGSHPREKPCGGGLTGRALDLVSGAVPVDALDGVVVESASFEHDAAAPVTLSLTGDRTGRPRLIVASRRAFDGALLAAAVAQGARLIPERVVAISRERRGIDVRTASRHYHCHRILAADGANSLVRRTVLAPFRRSQLSIATGYYAHGTSSTRIVIRFVSTPPGYIWSFPRDDHLAIGICGQADETSSAALRAQVGAWLTASGIARGARLSPYAWPIPSLGSADLDRECPAGDRWLLLGDAAGLVDPITREGIYLGLRSAEEAATCLTREIGREAIAYRERLQARLYPELRRAAQLKSSFFSPRFTRLLMDGLAASQAIRHVMADLVAGDQPYRGLRRRLLGTFELGLAWRVLRSRRQDRGSSSP